MQHKSILFDLDGTLTDSGEGIINCAILALNHFHLPVPSREEMRVFVGPPLHKTFLDFGILPEQVEEAVRVFRSRYTTVGKFENFPYPGIPELLAELKEQGHKLYVATSKPEETAKEILDKFDLSQYFTLICGASIALNRMEKAEVIELLLEQVGTLENTIMVGDTAFDVTGAAQHGIPTIGVSWGYGKVQDMVDAGAIAIADSTQQLLELLQA